MLNFAIVTRGRTGSTAVIDELGKIEQAQVHMREYIKTHPTLHLGFFEGIWKDTFQNPTDLERILNAMHKAGMRRL